MMMKERAMNTTRAIARSTLRFGLLLMSVFGGLLRGVLLVREGPTRRPRLGSRDWAIHFYGGSPVRRFDIAPVGTFMFG